MKNFLLFGMIISLCSSCYTAKRYLPEVCYLNKNYDKQNSNSPYQAFLEEVNFSLLGITYHSVENVHYYNDTIEVPVDPSKDFISQKVDTMNRKEWTVAIDYLSTKNKVYKTIFLHNGDKIRIKGVWYNIFFRPSLESCIYKKEKCYFCTSEDMKFKLVKN